jgi:hypothetical protein
MKEQPWAHLGKGRFLGPRIGRGSGKASQAFVVAPVIAEPALTTGNVVVAFDFGIVVATNAACVATVATNAACAAVLVAVAVALPAHRAIGEAVALCTVRSHPLQCEHTDQGPCTVRHAADTPNQRCAASIMLTMRRMAMRALRSGVREPAG